MTQSQFHSKVGEICKGFGAKSLGEDNYSLYTLKYGNLLIFPIDDWIGLRFETYKTGKVYDSLHGYDFNGYSGKWNIHLSAETKEIKREESLKWLQRKLKLALDAS